MDLTFDADLDIGEYVPLPGEDDKPYLSVIRLHSDKIPLVMEFTTGNPVVLEGFAKLFGEQAAKMRATPANTPLINEEGVVKVGGVGAGLSLEELEALTTPAAAGEGAK